LKPGEVAEPGVDYGNPAERASQEWLSLINLSRQCESGMGAPIWPDGGSLLDQPVKLVSAFNRIRGLSQYYTKDKKR
jgi:hypothetical protein